VLGLLDVFQAEEGGVDHLVLMDEDGAGEGLGFVAIVGAVADGREPALLGGEVFGISAFQHRPSTSPPVCLGSAFSFAARWPHCC
jgi:hypothetical protein